MAVEYLDKGNDDGTNFGRTDGKIGFYGLTTPIVQQTITTTVTAAGTIGACVTDLLALVTQLKASGLFA
jgi:hypothetical protein